MSPLSRREKSDKAAILRKSPARYVDRKWVLREGNKLTFCGSTRGPIGGKRASGHEE